jgi:hypothetical protein
MQIMYHTFLVLHIIGFVAAIGTGATGIVAYHQFWKLLALNRAQGIAAFKSFLKIRMLGLFGLLTTIIAGVLMEAFVHGAHAESLWFKIKMFLVLALLINGFTIGRTSSEKLNKLISGNDETLLTEPKMKKLKRETYVFQYSQLIIFFFIIIMAAFRFN